MKLTKQVRIFDESLSNSKPKLFDEVSGILYWDNISDQTYYELYKDMREKFWIPEEVSMSKDMSDWNNSMSPEEKSLFKEAIGVLAVLDSIATYFDNIAAHYIRDSAVKAIMSMIANFETIHNESYTYTLASLVSKEEAMQVFESPKTNPAMIKRNKLMMGLFDKFLETEEIEDFAKALVAMSALEGLCFVNGFTPFYHFNRNNKMFGTGTMIQYIQRDEIKHSYFQSLLVRSIMTQYEELNTEEFGEFCYNFFEELVEHEKAFCDDLYKDIPEIDVEEVKDYVEFRANLLLDNLGLDKIFSTKKNPMSWITAYDPDNLNNTKRDFFEDKEVNYAKPTESTNGWDDL